MLILGQGVPGLNATNTGDTLYDMLRLNMGIPPTANPSRLGVLDGDLAGFPNGRRVWDDVVDIEIRAVADGYGTFLEENFMLPNETPNNMVGDGCDANDKAFLNQFPYVAGPHSGLQRRRPPLARRAKRSTRPAQPDKPLVGPNGLKGEGPGVSSTRSDAGARPVSKGTENEFQQVQITHRDRPARRTLERDRDPCGNAARLGTTRGHERTSAGQLHNQPLQRPDDQRRVGRTSTVSSTWPNCPPCRHARQWTSTETAT